MYIVHQALHNKYNYMKSIQMVDLKSQYHNIKEEVDNAVLSVLESSAFIKGPEVKAFEAELANYLNVKHVIGCANGTDALQIALMACGLQPGDEVITPSYTYIATVEVIELLRLKPVYVDVDPNSFCLLPDEVEKAITSKTKAIIPVHLYGHSAPMDEIVSIAKKHNLRVIEDNAQAIGADYNGSVISGKTGTLGDIGCTSFFPSKNLGCFGDGGAIFTNNDELANKLKQYANHGQGERYHHDTIGVNSRLDSIQAAILRIKLRQLDNYTAARQSVAKYYTAAFAEFDELETPVIESYTSHVFHQFTIKSHGINRDELIKHLASKNIPAMIYYPIPSHLQKAYYTDQFPKGSLATTEDLCTRVFSLPIHTEMTEEQLELITSSVIEFVKVRVVVK